METKELVNNVVSGLTPENNSTDNTLVNDVYNHRARRYHIRNIMRNQKYFITDHLGTKRITNKLKVQTKKERYNYTNWFSRIKKSSEMGKKIERLHEEQYYNDESVSIEKREEQYLQLLKEIYGEERGNLKHELHLLNYEKRNAKKNDIYDSEYKEDINKRKEELNNKLKNILV